MAAESVCPLGPDGITAWYDQYQACHRLLPKVLQAETFPPYARLPGQAATGTAPAAAEDGPAPAGYQVDVLESLHVLLEAMPTRSGR